MSVRAHAKAHPPGIGFNLVAIALVALACALGVAYFIDDAVRMTLGRAAGGDPDRAIVRSLGGRELTIPAGWFRSGEPGEGVARGAYIQAEAEGGSPEVLLLATGSEVAIALAARDQLQAAGTPTRVVSMPCLEWFDEQDRGYRETVLPPSVKARVSVEAGATLGWWKYVGENGEAIGIDRFGASADGAVLYREFGITAENVAAAALRSLQRVSG